MIFDIENLVENIKNTILKISFKILSVEIEEVDRQKLRHSNERRNITRSGRKKLKENEIAKIIYSIITSSHHHNKAFEPIITEPDGEMTMSEMMPFLYCHHAKESCRIPFSFLMGNVLLLITDVGW